MIPITLPLALSVLLPASMAAQGSADDYARAARHRARFAGLVEDAPPTPAWLAPDRLVVRRLSSGGGWRDELVLAAEGRVEPVVDQDRLAASLRAATGRPFEADRLPLRVLTVDAETVQFALTETGEAYRALRDGSSLRPIESTDLPGSTIEPTERRRSRTGRGSTHLTVVNESDTAIQLVWLDESGRERTYETLEPGAQHRQHTYAGHVWLIRDEEDREAGPYEAASSPSTVRITESLLKTPRRRRDARSSSGRRNDSPDGRWRIHTLDARVELEHLETGDRHAIDLAHVPDGERTRRVLWSENGRTVALLRSVDAEARTIHMVESSPRDQKQPKLQSMRYRKPGDPIDALRVILVDVETKLEVPVRDEGLLANAWSMDELRFAPDGGELWVRTNRRGHQRLGFDAIDTRTGQVRTIVEERPETFVDYSQKCWMRHLPSRGELLWTSERSGYHHLYAVDVATGSIRALTSGDWVLRGLDDVDEERGTALIRGVGVFGDQDPYHVHVGRVDLVDGGVTWLTASDGTHEITWGPERRFLLAAWSRVDHPPVLELRDGFDGSLVMELGRVDATPLFKAGWRAPERFVAKGRDGTADIWGIIHTPTQFDPEQRYPVIESIYAGPHGHFVPKSWRVSRSVSQLTELGFVVVQIDGMGTNWRSKSFHDVCWRNLGDSGFPDRIAWMRSAAADRPWMDLSRVGTYGGSAGGQSSTRAVLAHGDFYDAAVSDCGCHDNRMDKIWWNEAWMGWPVEDHYASSSNVDLAHQLTGELLLIVGELDRNVDPASTMQVVDALIRADKDFDLLVIPGAGHGAAESRYGRRRRQDFFVEHLLGVEPRWSE